MKKTIPYLIVLLAALVVLWWWLGKREAIRQAGSLPAETGLVDSAAVTRFILERHNQPKVVIAKDSDGVWQMTDPVHDRANVLLAHQVVEGAAIMQLSVKVSSRSSQFSTFEVDDQEAAHLMLYAGDTLVSDLYLGKLAPDTRHLYVRLAGSDDVYTATGGGAMAALRTRAVNDFRNRQIYDFDLAAIDSVDVDGDGIHYRLARADSVSWRVQVGKQSYQPADPALSQTILRALGNLRANNFADDTTSFDFGHPLLTVHTWKLDGSTETLRFLAGEENSYWAQAEGNPHTYKVFQSVFQTFKRDPKTLVAAAS